MLGWYKDMLLIRRFEERAGQLYGMGLIGGFCHLYIGQEAIAVGVESIKRPGDEVITGYRAHGHTLAAGVDPKAVLSELTGRATGIARGKGGSMHMFSTEHDFFGGHGIVGAWVPLGTGLAFANRYRNDGKVSFTFLGDGAVNQGQVYEAFNMAELWKLPVVYVVENNQYAMGTSVERASAQTHLFRRGESFNIPGEEVDGMDIEAVREAAGRAAEFARSGKGPYILEMKTYRYRGHSMSDPAKYRTRDEVDEVRKTRDPIDHLREKLEAARLRRRGGAEGHRRGGEEDRRRRRRVRPHRARSRTRRNSTPTSMQRLEQPTRDRRPHARPLSHHGGGHAVQVEHQGRRQGVGRRRDRRDRDRQGDHGGRGRGRGVVDALLVEAGTEGVKVNAPIARLKERGRRQRQVAPIIGFAATSPRWGRSRQASRLPILPRWGRWPRSGRRGLAAAAPVAVAKPDAAEARAAANRRSSRRRPPRPSRKARGRSPSPPRRRWPTPTSPRGPRWWSPRCAMRSATPWPRRCAATTPSS